jgi:hypothetical protein
LVYEKFLCCMSILSISLIFELIFKYFYSNNSEPNFCKPGSHDFSVNFDFWFTYFHRPQKSREPVNHGTQLPKRQNVHVNLPEQTGIGAASTCLD